MIGKKKYNRIFILNDNKVLRINTALAEEIGFNESIMILQLEFLISISSNEIEGKKWTYQSAQDLKDNYFPFWSRATIQRTLKSIEKKKFLLSGNFNKRKSDRTRWYALNFDELAKLKSLKIDGYEQLGAQNEQSSEQDGQSNEQNKQSNGQNKPTLPENTAETTSEKNVCKKVSRQGSAGDILNSKNNISAFVYSMSGCLVEVYKSKQYITEKIIKNMVNRLKNINPNAVSLLENEGQIEAAISMCSNKQIGYPGLTKVIEELIELYKAERSGFEFEYPIPNGLTFIQIRNNYSKIKSYYKRMNNNDEYCRWYDNFI